jgi:hypothetical protein
MSSLRLASLVALGSLALAPLAIGCGGESPALDAGALDASGLDASSNDDTGVPVDAPSTPGEIADYCRPLAALLCTRASDCGCGAVLPGGMLDVAACTARWQGECESAWGPFVAAGARVDAARAAACVELVADASPTCGAPSGLAAFALCEPFVIDPAAIGEACTSPYCAGGAGACVRDGASATCAARLAEGMPCADMFACATGLACLEGTCAALGEVGDPCTLEAGCTPPLTCREGACRARAAMGASCVETRHCETGLLCEGGTCVAREGTSCDDTTPCGSFEGCAQPPSCRPRLTRGSACRESLDCGASLYCEDATHTCVDRPSDGQPCANGVICGPGLGCDMDGGGTCRPRGAAGSPCLFGEFGPFLCADGFACVDGTCGALPTEGMPCAGVDSCAAGLGCAFGPEGSICIVPRGEGEPCENRQACRLDLHCGREGTCAPDVAFGAPCDPGFGDCGGACVPDASGGFVCRSLLDEGATCLADEDCASGLTCLVRSEDTRCLPEICASL